LTGGQAYVTLGSNSPETMSADQFAVLIEEARSGRLDRAVAELTATGP
jgi:hypothetical protein